MALPTAFTKLYREHYAFVWRCARRLGARDADLDDVVQETFVIALRRFYEFGDAGPAHPPTWLFALLANVLRNHGRGQRRHLRKVKAVAVERAHHDVRLAPERGAMGSLARGLHDDFVDSLGEQQRAVYVLAELEGYSSREIGEALAISSNTVRSRLRAARAAFERRFTDECRAEVVAARSEHASPSQQHQRSTLQAIAAIELGHVGVGVGVSGSTVGGIGWASMWTKVAVGLVAGLGLVAATAPAGGVEVVAAVDPHSPPSRVRAESVDAASGSLARAVASEAAIEGSTDDPIPVVAPRVVLARPTPGPPPDREQVRALATLASARSALIEQRPSDALIGLATVSSWPDQALARRALAIRVGALCSLGRGREAEASVATWTGATLPDEIQHLCW